MEIFIIWPNALRKAAFVLTYLLAACVTCGTGTAIASECSIDPPYPLGPWDGTCIRDNPGRCTAALNFTGPTAGTWQSSGGEGTFSISAPLSPNGSVELRMSAGGGSYVLTSPMQVDTEGCCMWGPWSDNRGNSGILERCWLMAPVAGFSFSPSAPVPETTITFDGSTTVDPDGIIVAFDWDFDRDGVPDKTGIISSWTFTLPGDYPVSLTVVDDGGASDTVQKIVSVVGEKIAN